MNINSLLDDAIIFARDKHKEQFRSSKFSNEKIPYFNHVEEVANLIKKYYPDNIEMQCAAYLHDTLEDTNTSVSELINKFGENITNIVKEVTDDPELSKKEQKQNQLETMPIKSFEAQAVKKADKISNTKSLLTNPPNWNKSSILGYAKSNKNIVYSTIGMHPGLEDEFIKIYEEVIGYYQNFNSLKI